MKHVKLKLKLMANALAARLFKVILGPNVLAVITETADGLYAIDPEDWEVGRNLRRSGGYATNEIARLTKYLTHKSTALFVGAHIGSLVIPLSKLCDKTIAVEPSPITYKLLKMNLALNGISNCHAINIAAGDKEERIDFLVSRANSGGSKRVPRIRNYIYYYDNPQTISVDAFRLDDYLGEKDFDLIVMDIEGSEYFALKGMQDMLARSRVLAVEFLPHHLRNVSGVTVEEFLSLIEPHFSTLRIPSKGLKVEKSRFRESLKEMYDKEQGDEGIIFAKE